MPDITLCTNDTCEIKDNCKRAIVYNDGKPNQSYQYFEPETKFDHLENCFFYYNCKFQLKIKD